MPKLVRGAIKSADQTFWHGTGTPAKVSDVRYIGHDAIVELALLPDGPNLSARILGTDLPSTAAQQRVRLTGTSKAFAETEPAVLVVAE